MEVNRKRHFFLCRERKLSSIEHILHELVLSSYHLSSALSSTSMPEEARKTRPGER